MAFQQDLIDGLKQRIELAALIGRYVTLKREGREQKACCPFHNEKTPSFTVVPHKGFFHCFGCGAHGDAIGFLMRIEGLDFRTAVEHLANELGGAVMPVARARRPMPARGEPAEARARKRKIEMVRGIWHASHPAVGTPAQTYLRSRGITIVPPPSLRYHGALRHPDAHALLPAMIGGIQGADRALIGVHRTFLKGDGGDKAPGVTAKMMLGEAWGGAIRLSPPAELWIVGEGIETVLSVMQVALADGGMLLAGRQWSAVQLCFWAALSLGNIAGGGIGQGRPHPGRVDACGRPILLPGRRPDPKRPGVRPPPEAKAVAILADADNRDPAAAEDLLQRGARRFQQLGLETLILRPPAGYDFNDVISGI